MNNYFPRIVSTALLSAAAGMSFAGKNPILSNPAGSRQSTVAYKSSNEVLDGKFRGRSDKKRDLMAKLEVEVPLVEVDLFGEKYSVGGSRVCIPIRLTSNLDNGVGAYWDPADNVIVITEKEYDWEQLDAGFKKWYQGGASMFGLDDEEDVFWKKLRHEAVHAIVDSKYKKCFEDKNGNRQGEVDDWYRFVSEMLAYVGGDGMSAKEAAEMIRDHPELYNKDFKASDIAKKLLEGEPYTPPESGLNKKGRGDSYKPISMDVLKIMDLDDENGDWCKCEIPGCIKKVKIVEGKHIGLITFECSSCEKVNVKFAKEALAFEQTIKAEGGTPQWCGSNAEEKAKAASCSAK